MAKKIAYVDMDGVIVDFYKAVEGMTEVQKEAAMNEPGFFYNLKKFPGTDEGLKFLVEHFDVYILSTAPWNNLDAWKEKRMWIEKHLPEYFTKRLILSHYKNLCHGDYLIDDRLKNGAEDFAGELILFGSDTFPNWESVINYLKINHGKIP